MSATTKRNGNGGTSTAIQRSSAHDIQNATTPPETQSTGMVFVPPVDVIDAGPEYLILADLPGATADQISVTFEQSLITLRANVQPRWGGSARTLRSEYGVGDYRRTFRVGEDVDSERISGEYSDGVLTVHIPKRAENRPKRIEVRAA